MLISSPYRPSVVLAMVVMYMSMVMMVLSSRDVDLLQRNNVWRMMEHERPSPSHYHHIRLAISIPEAQLRVLDNIFHDVVEPTSAPYGQYLTLDELSQITTAPSASTQAITTWIQSNSRHEVTLYPSKSGDMLRVKLCIEDIERLLNVEMRTFRHRDGREMFRSLQLYSLPKALEPHIDIVHGVSDFPWFFRRYNRDNSAVVYDDSDTPFWRSSSTPGSPVIVGASSRRAHEIDVKFTVAPTASSKLRRVIVMLFSDISSIDKTLTFNLDSVCQTSSDDHHHAQHLLSCATTVHDVPLQIPFRVQVQPIFDDGEVGGVDIYEFPVISNAPVSPAKISEVYSVPQHTVATNQSNSQCVVEFEQQYFSTSDLYLFQSRFGLEQQCPKSVIGPNDETNPGVEAGLDIQYIMGVAPNVNTTFWSIEAKSSVEIDDILEWLYQVGNTTDVPLVNSISYGMR